MGCSAAIQPAPRSRLLNRSWVYPMPGPRSTLSKFRRASLFRLSSRNQAKASCNLIFINFPIWLLHSPGRSSFIKSTLLVFSFGSAEKGQLGNGTTGERITTGNKTAYDIEPYPSAFLTHSPLSGLDGLIYFVVVMDSLHQRVGWQKGCSDYFWSAA